MPLVLKGIDIFILGLYKKKIHTMGAMGDDCRGPGK